MPTLEHKFIKHYRIRHDNASVVDLFNKINSFYAYII